jgi:hypothetical protein
VASQPHIWKDEIGTRSLVLFALNQTAILKHKRVVNQIQGSNDANLESLCDREIEKYYKYGANPINNVAWSPARKQKVKHKSFLIFICFV